MDEGATPAVIGRDADGVDAFYIVDDHHTLAALDASGYEATTVTLGVLCDLRALSPDDFWTYLATNNFTFLAAHPGNDPDAPMAPIKPAEMPTTLSFLKGDISFADDPWRSLAGFSRKVRDAPAPAPACDDYKYCNRCFNRGCGATGDDDSGPLLPFYEFRWGYFMLDAYLTESLWPSAKEHDEFAAAYQALPLGGFGTDTEAWAAAAALLIPLCRSGATGEYRLPSNSIFPGDGGLPLPGFYEGYTPLPADPTCSAPLCDGGGRRRA